MFVPKFAALLYQLLKSHFLKIIASLEKIMLNLYFSKNFHSQRSCVYESHFFFVWPHIPVVDINVAQA